ncbi:hypothetical protein ACIQU4_27865 [Streptomyces sp. NPDC090741]|uniref:hypothetical protein n=1 Tax=Streptomyces sp. NPDC090741 TaxID=3365967 RepID=UPI003809DE8F
MPLPEPFSLAALIENMEKARGRHIRLVPIPDHLLGATSLCGLWLKNQSLPVDLILYVDSTTAFHREAIILHELTHLWCDDAEGATNEDVTELLAGFPPELVKRLVGSGQAAARHRYGTRKESRAEMVACLIQQQVHSYRDLADPGDDEVLRALGESLAYPTRRRRV